LKEIFQEPSCVALHPEHHSVFADMRPVIDGHRARPLPSGFAAYNRWVCLMITAWPIACVGGCLVDGEPASSSRDPLGIATASFFDSQICIST
jgi:hypothetical protein